MDYIKPAKIKKYPLLSTTHVLLTDLHLWHIAIEVSVEASSFINSSGFHPIGEECSLVTVVFLKLDISLNAPMHP